MSASAIIDDLLARRLIQDHTDLDALRERLERGPMTLYVGFDPTAESLHIGNLVPLLLLRRFQLAGHLPIALAGGATGMIGDPGGRSEERNLLDTETLDRNTRAIKAQLSAFLDFEPGPCQARLVDNRDWTAPMGVLDFLRDVGKHVTVNYMLAKESVRSRVASEHGISFTEFSYMLLQAHDYAWLHEHTNCELQAGGSDQWGNITAGIDLVRRRSGASVHGLTVPLVTRSDGEKFGKSVDGALWLDPERTSPYALYQYFVNLPDDDVERYLLQLTLVPVDEARRVAAEHARAPERRAGQQRLAWEMTALIHGPEAADEAAAASTGFTSAAGSLSAEQLAALTRRDPHDALCARRPRGRRPPGREQARGQQGRGAPPDRGRRHLRQRRRARRGPAAGQRRSPARPLRDAAQGQAPAAPARLERGLTQSQQERSGVTASTLSSTTWIRPLASRRRPPWRPVRVPTISARMEIAVSSGVCAPMSSPTGPGDAFQLLVGDARGAQAVAALLLRTARAERSDVADAAAQRACDRRVVQLGIVREHDDVILGPEVDLVVALLRPLDDELGRPTGCARASRTRASDRSRPCASRARRPCGRASRPCPPHRPPRGAEAARAPRRRAAQPSSSTIV